MQTHKFDAEKLKTEQKEIEQRKEEAEKIRLMKEAFRQSEMYAYILKEIDGEIQKLDSLSNISLSHDERLNTVALLAQQQTIVSLKSLKKKIL